MKEYIEKDAALEATYAPFTMSMRMTVPECNGMNRAREMIFKQLRAIPAADVRPVVLCRDCKHRDPEDHKCDSGEMERQGCPFKVADNYFCAYGER